MREMIAFEKVGRTARIVSDGDFSYSYGNVVSVYDGRGKAELTYNRSGFSVSVKDPSATPRGFAIMPSTCPFIRRTPMVS